MGYVVVVVVGVVGVMVMVAVAVVVVGVGAVRVLVVGRSCGTGVVRVVGVPWPCSGKRCRRLLGSVLG